MQQASYANSKRIAKNTLLLYFRMLFLMLVSLYTSRVILNALGVEDYGIYTVVAGTVTMFSVLSGALSSAISRFLTFELGKGNEIQLRKIFSTSVTIQAAIVIIILLLAETIGLWFVNEKLTIPESRITAANWCYQFSIITFAINLIYVPYNAAIIAHEKMSAFAYISILEALGKLLVAWCIVISPIDRLVFFAALVAMIAWSICFIYIYYCRHYFDECKYRFYCDYPLLKQMFSFAGWNFIGVSASILRDQGGNIVINMFCGPTVNAARGITTKVNAAINGFVQNFMIALNPQIIKSYASENRDYMMSLLYRGARFSFYLLLLLSLPIFAKTEYVLTLWLRIVPEHTVNFVWLILLFTLHESLANPLITAMLATGNIRNYQIIAGGLNLLNLPVSYYALRLGYEPESVLIIAIFFSIVVQIARLVLLKQMIMLDIWKYIKKVYINVIIVAVVSSVIPLLISKKLDDSFDGFLLSSLSSFIWTGCVVWLLGMDSNERQMISTKALTYIKNHF